MRPHPLRHPVTRWIGVALALAAGAIAAGALTADAQELERQARAAARQDGVVRLAYPAAGNVCGTGDGILIREPDGSTMFVSGRLTHSEWNRWRAGDPPCRTGDVQVVMRPDRAGDGAGWHDVRIVVGEPIDARVDGSDLGGPARDLGFYTGQEAADFLLAAARASDGRTARRLIMAAAIAGDAEVWPQLLAMARNRDLSARTREGSLHWLGRRAAREAVEGLGGIVRDRTEDDRIREAAVFALSQLPDDQAVPILIDVVRTMDDARVVNRALFWLAEFDDPRAVALFEEILAGRGR